MGRNCMHGQGAAWREHGAAQGKHNGRKRNGLLWEWMEAMSGINTVHGLAERMDGSGMKARYKGASLAL